MVAGSHSAAGTVLYEGLPPEHPLRGFHAGNRDSLKVEQPAFQQALKDFHQRFYRTGQMTLSLVGPQSLRRCVHWLSSSPRRCRLGITLRKRQPSHCRRKVVNRSANSTAICCLPSKRCPTPAPKRWRSLRHCLNNAKPGGLLAHLQQQKLADSLKATPLYHFAGQALLHLQLTAPAECLNVIREHVLDWLSFFAAQQDWPALRDEYARLLERQQVGGALHLARLDCEQLEHGLSEHGVVALKQILRDIGVVDNFSAHWHLPAPILSSAPANHWPTPG